MASTPLAWGPREGKSLCIIELSLAPDFAYDSYPLAEVLRMFVDFCSWAVLNERHRIELGLAPDFARDSYPLADVFRIMVRQSEEVERNPQTPTVEVIPPTTLFTDPANPGVRINVGLPGELTAEVRNQFGQKWQELREDVRQCGMGSFLDWYKIASVIPLMGGHVPKGKYPLNRWWRADGLICVKNPLRPV